LISRRAVRSPAALSYAQEQLWFLEQLFPGRSVYNISIAVDLHGGLDVKRLQQVFEQIGNRHEVLRTTFEDLGNGPLQRVGATTEARLKVVDLSILSAKERSKRKDQILEDEAFASFDLVRGPLWRISLLRLAAHEYTLAFTMHHIISEAWTFAILFREISIFYRSEALGPVPLHYSDFAEWQRSKNNDVEDGMEYWLEKLESPIAPLDFPSDRPRVSIRELDGAWETRCLSQAVTNKVRKFTQSEQSTSFSVLLAAYIVLLFRYTSNPDILVGIPVSNRSRAELENMVGLFVNTIVIRSDLSQAPSFRELLFQVRRNTMDALEYRDIPFEKLVRTIHPDRDLLSNPLFQVAFVQQDVSHNANWRTALDLPGIDALCYLTHSRTSKFDLTLEVEDSAEGLLVSFEYATDLFDQATISRLLEQYETILTSAISEPDRSIMSLEILPAWERRLVKTDWNDTIVDYPYDKCIHELFEQQMELAPDAISIVIEDQELSYRELNERANQLAHYLRSLGVDSETLVGVYLNRSVNYIVSVLGILKAGSAYVPLDANYPKQRLKFVLTDAKIGFLVTQHSSLDRLPATDSQLICLDADSANLQAMPCSNPSINVAANNLAYVMYTSGSTGTPKGVAVMHRSISRLVRNTNYVDLTAEDCIAHVSNISFDSATFEIWGALLCGARLAICPNDAILSAYDFAEFLCLHKVTTLALTAAVFNQYVAAQPDIFSSLKQVLFGGESADAETVRKILRHNPPDRLLNVYGPTENTCITTWQLIQEVASDARTVPIGQPISNTQVYVLDTLRQLVPIGVPGELYIGGAGLAQGYLNRSELTDERFVADPFSNDPDAKLYRTGDLCRWREEGYIEFMGRLDNQVKLRGFRIELGEIEAALRQQAHIASAVVILRKEGTNHQYIAAYLTTEKNQSIAPDNVRSTLGEILPGYMIPTTFTVLEDLPLTPNGKVDRKALERLSQEKRVHTSNTTDSHQLTELEQRVIEVWEEVLQVKNINPNDNFFDLGGHSMLAVNLIFKTEAIFGIRLPFAIFIQAPTVVGFAHQLQQETGSATYFTLVPTSPQASSLPLFCVYGLYLYKPLALALGPDQRTYGIYLEFESDLRAGKNTSEAGFEFTVENIASRYIEQIRKIEPSGPYNLAGLSFGGLVAFEIAHQLLEQGEKVNLLALFDTYAPVPMKFHMIKTSLNWARHLYAKKLSHPLDYGQHKFVESKDKQGSIEDEMEKINVEQIEKVMKKYKLRSYPGDIVIYRAEETSRFDMIYPDDLGWKPYVPEGLKIVNVPGDHLSILSDPNVHIIADSIKVRLIGD